MRRRFPTITHACTRVGLDVATDRIPVSPAAHYMMGGVETDLHGRTSVEGLFAAGEVACTGVHGANRLASNSLLEGLVFGARAADAMRSAAERPSLGETGPPVPRPTHGAAPLPRAAEVRDVMWRHVGLVRTRDGLEEAVTRLGEWLSGVGDALSGSSPDRERRTLATLVRVGLLIATAALRREESRGGHFRADFPTRDDLHWHRHVSDVRPQGGPVGSHTEP